MAPHTRLHQEIFHETVHILRCDGKGGNPFQTKQGNRPSYRDQEGRRGSDEVVPGTSVFLSISDIDHRVSAELEQEGQASSCVEEWNSACLSSCSQADRTLVEFYLEPVAFTG